MRIRCDVAYKSGPVSAIGSADAVAEIELRPALTGDASGETLT
jgi:hypothetical protein